jgi:succinyl-diaminopimelate desuccinylase
MARRAIVCAKEEKLRSTCFPALVFVVVLSLYTAGCGGENDDIFGPQDQGTLEVVFQEGNGTTYALTQLASNGQNVNLRADIRYTIGHQSVAWDGTTEGLLSGRSIFPDILDTLVSRFNAIYPDAHLTFQTRTAAVPDLRNPDSERFQRVREACEEVVGESCPLVATGGNTDAHGYANLLAAGALFSSDFGPPVNFHGIEEGAPIADLRLSAQILWHILLRYIDDPAMQANDAFTAPRGVY